MIIAITNQLIVCNCGCEDMGILAVDDLKDDEMAVECMDCEERYLLKMAKDWKLRKDGF